jgi:tetratricopeptide (TPR) repeat protein
MVGRSSIHQQPSVSRDALFGREREQGILAGALRRMHAGQGGLLLVSGDAGIGKTTLINAALVSAEEDGARIFSSACYDLTVTPPYGAWGALINAVASRNGSALNAAEAVVDRQSTPRASSQDELFNAVIEFLHETSTQQPIIVVLEDLHWTDTASLELLRYVARQISEHSVLIIATYRDTEIDRQHALHHMMPLLVRESSTTRISVRPLESDAIRALIREHYTLSTADETRLIDYLLARTEGNPFFIEETLRTLEERALIYASETGWAIGDLGLVPIPPLVQQVVDGRLARLDERERDLLAIAAVIGAEVPLDTWCAAIDRPETQLSDAIRRFIELNLLEEVNSGDRLRFTHALVREALYMELSPLQRRTLHRVIGSFLASQPRPEPDTVAYHLNQASSPEAAGWLLLAGERAQDIYAWRTAAERFEALLPLFNESPTETRACGWLYYRIGLLLIYADPYRGIAHLREAERIADLVKDEHLAAYACADRGLLRCITGDVRRGLKEMTSGVNALDILPVLERTDPHPEVRGAAPDLTITAERIQRGALELIGAADHVNIRKGALVFWLAWSGRYTEAIIIGEPYVEQIAGSGAGIEDSLGDALAGLGHAYAALGQPDRALSSFAQARDVFGRIDHHFKVGNTAIYELSEALLPFRADRIMQREWLADQAEAG